jgi:hypothetical protein
METEHLLRLYIIHEGGWAQAQEEFDMAGVYFEMLRGISRTKPCESCVPCGPLCDIISAETNI